MAMEQAVYISYFNSTRVRLKVCKGATYSGDSERFQFHKGTAKSVNLILF